jgi:putative transposase
VRESSFIEKVLRASVEEMERRYRLRAQGYDLGRVARRVGEVTGIEPERIWVRGRYAEGVKARSLFCYWAVRQLGVTETESARRFEMTQPAVSTAVKRGEALANAKGWRFPEE